MTDRSVWAVDTPGVEHRASDVRAQIYTAHSGESGIILHGGGGLVATPGDSTKVRVLPCSVVAVSRYPGHVQQSYSFRVHQAVDVQIRPGASTPASGRTDAIILRVRDRSVEGTTVPADPNSVDYWEPQVIEGVPPTTGYTEDGIAARYGIRYPFVLIGLARVEANKSAVAEINFLANAIHPRIRQAAPQVIHFDSNSMIGRTGNVYQDLGGPVWFDVPSWATHATVTAIVSGMVLRNASSYGNLSAIVAGVGLRTPTRWDMDVASGGFTRGTYAVAGAVYLAPAKRGTPQPFQLRASNAGTGSFGVGVGSSMILNVTFTEQIDLGWG